MKKRTLASALIVSALSFSTPTLAATEINISTGVEGGGYMAKGDNARIAILKRANKKGIDVNVNVLEGSSLANIESFNAGDSQVIFTQNDARNVKPITEPNRAVKAGSEYILWGYNIKHGYSDLESIEGKEDVVMVMVEDSGATVTMSSFVNEDGGYAKNQELAVEAIDLEDAMEITASGEWEGKKVAGFLHVGSNIPSELAQAFRGLIRIGSASDKDFNDAQDADGNDLYYSCEVTSKQANGLTGFLDPNTVCVNAFAVYSTDTGDKKLDKILRKTITKSLRYVK